MMVEQFITGIHEDLQILAGRMEANFISSGDTLTDEQILIQEWSQ